MHKIHILYEDEFIYKSTNSKLVTAGSFTWKAPSNIALVKYWGKRSHQLPENPSISLTLDACFTQTTLEFKKKSEQASTTKTVSDISASKTSQFELYLDGERKIEFEEKIGVFIARISPFVPFINDYSLIIKTHNSFPHSSGIASSASGMAALALCIMSIEKALNPQISEEIFFKKASFLARLGSGSAARSIRGQLVVWGAHEAIAESADLYGVEFPGAVHNNFKNYQDIILLVDKGEKQVSSTVGHNLMHGHPFAKKRFKQAHKNLSKLAEILQNGDLNAFVTIVESEALTLHAMMMTSHPYFILMKPNTLTIINKIWEFRAKSNSHICFTLDAGANVHVLFPEKEKEGVLAFIKSELLQFCQNNQYICDTVGVGAKQM